MVADGGDEYGDDDESNHGYQTGLCFYLRRGYTLYYTVN